MFDDQLIRLVNACLGVVALLLAGWRWATVWKVLPPRLRLLALSLLAFIFTGTFGSIEARIDHAPLGWRSYMVGVAFIWTIVALTVTPKTTYDR